jgi:hypothetical protein
MKTKTKNDAHQLTGWTIRSWSLLPTQLFILELINFGASSAESRNLGRVICTRPSSVSMQGFNRLPGQVASIVSANLDRASGSIRLEIEVTRGGRAVVVAEDLDMFFY